MLPESFIQLNVDPVAQRRIQSKEEEREINRFQKGAKVWSDLLPLKGSLHFMHLLKWAF